MKKYDWTPERIAELKKIYSYQKTSDIALNFGFSTCAIYNMAYALGLKKDKEFLRSAESGRIQKGNIIPNSEKTRFQKGHIPQNKGKKQKEYMSREAINRTKNTRFKKGHIPVNAVPVGYERVDKDGYVYIKVSDERKLVLKHRHVWEQHNGAIPKGCNIQFKDGNRHNCNIDNLYIISRSKQLKTENSLHARYPDEVKRLIQLKGALNRQINKITSKK